MKLRLILPVTYGAFAALAWLDFARLPPDGLANLGLMVAVAPVSLADLAMRPIFGSQRSLFIPSGLGYYPAHAVFFAASATFVAAGLYALGRAIDRKSRPGPER